MVTKKRFRVFIAEKVFCLLKSSDGIPECLKVLVTDKPKLGQILSCDEFIWMELAFIPEIRIDRIGGRGTFRY